MNSPANCVVVNKISAFIGGYIGVFETASNKYFILYPLRLCASAANFYAYRDGTPAMPSRVRTTEPIIVI